MPLTPSQADENLEEFLACARYGEIDELRIFPEIVSLAQKIDPVSGNTALMFASANGHLEIVTLLLEISRSVINVQNVPGNTALHWAAINGQSGVVAALLAAGADANFRNAGGDRPFDEALRRQVFPEICEMLAKATLFEEDAETAAMMVDAGVELVVSDVSDQEP
jgi:ankyrin repeat protein